MRKKSKTSKGPGFGRDLHAIVKLVVMAGTAFTMLAFAGQAPKTADDRVSVRYTEVRQAAGITFLQDGTATDEKYYLETMGTGVAWLDYDQPIFTVPSDEQRSNQQMSMLQGWWEARFIEQFSADVLPLLR